MPHIFRIWKETVYFHFGSFNMYINHHESSDLRNEPNQCMCRRKALVSAIIILKERVIMCHKFTCTNVFEFILQLLYYSFFICSEVFICITACVLHVACSTVPWSSSVILNAALLFFTRLTSVSPDTVNSWWLWMQFFCLCYLGSGLYFSGWINLCYCYSVPVYWCLWHLH